MIIAKEIIAPYKNTDGKAISLFARINIHKEADKDSFLLNRQGNETAVLFCEAKQLHPSQFNEALIDRIIDDHVNCAKNLMAGGVTHFAIATDNDGFFQRLLSPRFSILAFDSRIKPLITLYQKLGKLSPHVGVFLTVEELAPGGMDAKSGVRIASILEAEGLVEIVATSGTKDFMPLYDRRATRKKRLEHEDFYSNEPALASALWLLQHTGLRTWCLAFLDDKNKAISLAKTLGLEGLIEKAQITDI